MNFRRLTIPAFAIVAVGASGHAARAAEIRVSLFGQPCLLEGPTDEKTLTNVHAISPERMPPIQSLDETRESLERVKRTTPLPAALDGYREKLTKRLTAQLVFLEKLAELRKNGKLDAFTAATQDAVLPRNQKTFKATLKRLASKQTPTAWGPDKVDQLTESYGDWIEPHPEEEFHRSIQRAKIHYNCQFEENSGGLEEDDESEEAPEASPSSAPSPAAKALPAPASTGKR